ncbi:universal stress protein [Dethiobacter alkaliphilus]|uniref:universal stress protein n=1 Tax=Dethiobacter alkaliphilus TaxID=427926 RepID=UPI002226D25D|nr:universal stress protein [Dethiobacter alkaliphilus]MCW3489532.1 universal stress protein [Dethiobacter alkaliphilus]
MEKILVATDGSETANKALGYALQLAEALKADITVISVAQEVPMAMSHEGITNADIARFKDNMLENMKKSAQEALNRAEKLFQQKGVAVNTRLEVGDPARVITDVAEKESFDQVIIGSRGLGGIRGMVLGSVSNKVVNSVKTNVTVIR